MTTPNETNIAQQLANELEARATTGLTKYGVSLDNASLTPAQVLQHAKEEALDLASYIQRILNPLRPTLMGTLIQWCAMNEVVPEFASIDGKAVVSVPAIGSGEIAHIHLAYKSLWSYDLEIGIPYDERNGGWIDWPTDLLALLSRLIDKECEGRGS